MSGYQLPPRPARTKTDVVGGIFSTLALLAFAVGVPFLLYAMDGSPLPHDIPSWEQIQVALMRPDNGELFLATLLRLAWLSWAVFAVLVVVELAAQLRGLKARRLPVFGSAQQGVSLLVAAALGLLIQPASFNDNLYHSPVMITQSAVTSDHQTAPAPAPQAAPVPEVEYSTYVVKRGDTLWSIAQALLGDGNRYREISELNYGLPQPDGHALTDDHWISPGWTLRIPTPPEPGNADLPRRSGSSYVVKPGDTLSEIAETQLGDTRRYPQIAALNTGKHQPDGRRLVDEDLIYPGWVLALPTRTSPSEPAEPRAPAESPPNTPATPHESSSPVPPSRQPAPGSQASSPSDAAERSEPDERGDRTWVQLPSGGVVGMSLAIAVTAALARARLHRRRTWRPNTSPEASVQPPLRPAARILQNAALTHRQDPPSSDDDELGTVLSGLKSPPSTDITDIALGGLGLAGAGGRDAIRALFLAVLAEPDVEIITTTGDLDWLAGSLDERTRACLNDLVITPHINDALAIAESELIHRARPLSDLDTGADLKALREHFPGEPLPTMLIITAEHDQPRPRLAAILHIGQQFGIGAIIAGEWPDGTTHTIDHQGYVSTDSSALIDRFSCVPLSDAADLIEIIASGRADYHNTPSQDQPAVVVTTSAAPSETSEPSDTINTETAHSDQREIRYETTAALAVEATDAAGKTEDDHVPRPVVVTLFGTPSLVINGTPITTGMRTAAWEVFTYLALRPAGASPDEAIDAIWTDDEPSTARETFHSGVRNIREITKKTLGDKIKVLRYEARRYRLDPDYVDIDVWTLRERIRTARTATDHQEKITVLGEVADLYAADLASTLTRSWITAEREALHREAMAALESLAQLHQQRDQPEKALDILEAAIRRDPHSERFYQQIMRLQAAANRPDAVQRTYNLLRSRLAELDADPAQDTEKLLTALLSNRPQPEPHSGSGQRRVPRK